MPIEFSELSKKYSDSRSSFLLLEEKATDIVKMEKELDELQLELDRYTDENIQTLEGILLEDDINVIKSRKATILERIQEIRDNETFQKRNELRSASEKLDEYIELAESNPEFMKEVYSSIIRLTQSDIQGYQDDKRIDEAKLDLIKKLQEKADEDVDLKFMLSIDSDKYRIYILKEAQRLGLKSSTHKEPDWSDRAIKSAEDRIEENGNKLRKYIEDHADELGLSIVDFDDPDSPLAFIKDYTDKTKLDVSLESIEEELEKTVNEKDKKILASQEEQDLAQEDLERLNEISEQVEENIFDKIATFFSRLKPKNIINYFLGRDDLIETSKPKQQEEVVNSSGNWRDSINTPIGNDEINKIRKEYQEKINIQNNNNNPRSNGR